MSRKEKLTEVGQISFAQKAEKAVFSNYASIDRNAEMQWLYLWSLESSSLDQQMQLKYLQL